MAVATERGAGFFLSLFLIVFVTNTLSFKEIWFLIFQGLQISNVFYFHRLLNFESVRETSLKLCSLSFNQNVWFIISENNLNYFSIIKKKLSYSPLSSTSKKIVVKLKKPTSHSATHCPENNSRLLDPHAVDISLIPSFFIQFSLDCITIVDDP